jgi:hypothetical protein
MITDDLIFAFFTEQCGTQDALVIDVQTPPATHYETLPDRLFLLFFYFSFLNLVYRYHLLLHAQIYGKNHGFGKVCVDKDNLFSPHIINDFPEFDDFFDFVVLVGNEIYPYAFQISG